MTECNCDSTNPYMGPWHAIGCCRMYAPTASATDPLNATYTAAEVKVLTEAASKVAYALGRKDAGEEAALKADGDCRLCLGLGGIALHEKWSAARGKPLWTAHVIPNDDPHPTYPCPLCVASQPSQAASDATSGVPGHQEVSEGPQVLHKPFDDDGVTYCGWATGSQIIDGCGEVWPCTTVRARESGAVRSPQEPAVCRRCFHTAHEEIGECRVCYCRSATKGDTP